MLGTEIISFGGIDARMPMLVIEEEENNVLLKFDGLMGLGKDTKYDNIFDLSH